MDPSDKVSPNPTPSPPHSLPPPYRGHRIQCSCNTESTEQCRETNICTVVLLFQILTRPLVALCDFQIRHGAVQHQSREYKIENGLWTKPLPRAVQRRMEQRKDKRHHQGGHSFL